jgi:hypothetical protein
VLVSRVQCAKTVWAAILLAALYYIFVTSERISRFHEAVQATKTRPTLAQVAGVSGPALRPLDWRTANPQKVVGMPIEAAGLPMWLVDGGHAQETSLSARLWRFL